MRRREFVTLRGGAVTAWPLALCAAPETMPVVGFLDRGSSAGMEAHLTGFHKGLAETDYAEGKSVSIEYRRADNHYDRLPVLASERVRRPVAVIAATRSYASALAAKAPTSTIPIVFQTGGDPVKDGLVASMNSTRSFAMVD